MIKNIANDLKHKILHQCCCLWKTPTEKNERTYSTAERNIRGGEQSKYILCVQTPTQSWI